MKTRSKFIAEAIQHELDRRRRADVEALVVSNAGKPIRWLPGEGWV